MRKEVIGDARMTAIYALCDPDNSPRYVGKTVRYLHERHKAHITTAKNRPRLPVHCWMRKRLDVGQPLVIWLLEYVAPEADWAARERYWIERFRARGDRLLNLTDGGEGLAGLRKTQAQKDLIASKLRTGAHFNCETCGERFWRKRHEIDHGDCRFCSRPCYAASLKGVSRPVPKSCTVRGVAAAAEARRSRTDCKRGHPLSGDNLFINSSGSRGCKECRKLHKAAHRERARG